MPKKVVSLPKYCFHKSRGLAYMRVDGKFIYLGEYGSPASKEAYGRILAELAANPTKEPLSKADTGLTVVELCALYLDFARGYYRKGDRMTSQVRVIRQVIKALNELYARTPANEFGPLALQAVQLQMVERNLSRKTVNQFCDALKRMFKWGVSKQLIPVAVYQALLTVRGIPQGRGMARETAPIAPVASAVVDATLPYLPAIVADMVRLQRLTGCRPGEVCIIRPMDVDRSGEIWEYRPSSHKTEHHGKDRIIFVGPQAQDILRPYLLRPADAFCLQPSDSEDKRHAEQRAKRQSKVQPSQQHRRKARRQRQPLTVYTKDSYGRAISQTSAPARMGARSIRRTSGNAKLNRSTQSASSSIMRKMLLRRPTYRLGPDHTRGVHLRQRGPQYRHHRRRYSSGNQSM